MGLVGSVGQTLCLQPLTTALAVRGSNSLPPYFIAAQGTGGRGNIESCSQLSRSAP